MFWDTEFRFEWCACFLHHIIDKHIVRCHGDCSGVLSQVLPIIRGSHLVEGLADRLPKVRDSHSQRRKMSSGKVKNKLQNSSIRSTQTLCDHGHPACKVWGIGREFWAVSDKGSSRGLLCANPEEGREILERLQVCEGERLEVNS